MEYVKGFVLPWRIYFNLDYSDLLDDPHSTVIHDSQQNILKYVIFGNTDLIHL